MLTACSIVSSAVAEAARMWNLMVIAFGSSSPALSNRVRFPTFFRTHPSATVHNPTRVKLCQKWNWKRISFLQETQEVFTSTIEDLEKRVKDAGMEIFSRQSFLTEPDNAIQNLKREDARIIIGVFYEDMARRVFCEVYKQKLYGPRNVWMIIGWYPDEWYKTPDPKVNCTAEQLMEALQYHITTEALILKPDDTPSISGMTSDEYEVRISDALNVSNPTQVSGYPESPLAYDAIWSIALALNQTANRLADRGLKLENYTYGNLEIADEIFNALNTTNFPGLSGQVAFTATGDRVTRTQIEQMIDGKYHKIAYYDSLQDNLTWLVPVEWWGGNGPPKDGVDTKPQLRVISKNLFIPVCVLAGLAIIFACVCIIFNMCFRHTGYISCSQPHINNLTAIGCIIGLMSVFLMGLDGQYISEDQFPMICSSVAWLLAVAFSLGYGAMFSKIWMMHSLVTQEKSESEDGRRRRRKISLQKVEVWKMYLMIGVLLVVDLVLLTVWQIIDPLYRLVEDFDKEEHYEEDLEIQPQLEHCEANHLSIWLGILYAINGLLLIFGLFLAYETRNMTVRDLNDSRYVGMSVYNVSVLCIITAPVTIIIRSQQDAVFGFAALTVIFCSTITLILTFVPKMLFIRKNPDGMYTKNMPGLAAPSREDEEKHQRLSADNIEIKRQIAERERRIRHLTDLITQRAKTVSSPTSMQNKPPERSISSGSPTTTRRSRSSFGPDKLTPPTMSCEDSAFVSVGVGSSALSASLPRGQRNSAASEEEFSETYI
ncbi:gamma-aminobutyric acid type B receptor subunit 1-like [Patiria miniata]|uniref:G-protein coupled receptors family 3 profile domain-containing protein n=1 Tax=Patiria miniata TaxID=46514 RepID=A0A914AKJ9_PATMI|nr:gamma-aminobutyric acid type B receptor subunit 1-like [Patiria miniata]